ncbi:MAG TPA: aldehyde dehydrogenase family protein [Anaerolineales bacterium]|nr:aldehyde dehydrogenase family protein [Anaerolineales bacterium]
MASRKLIKKVRRPVRPAARKKVAPAAFKLTYATMFNPPEKLHTNFDAALAKVKAGLGQDHPMYINGQERFSPEKLEDRSPINSDWLLGTFQKGSVGDVREAIAGARAAFPLWSGMRWEERVRMVRKAAALIEKRVYEIAAVVSLEVGKNRMEALGDVQETADLLYYACDQMEANHGYVKAMGVDPLVGFKASNISVLRPYGVWVVISPFNFPSALSGGPIGSALVTGNCVVFKPASDTPWTGRKLAECFRDAGLPAGVFNYITGSGSTVGEELITNPGIDGITFTGSFDVGMRIYSIFTRGKYPRPVILEMGGKNPAIVSRNANLDDAAIGILRSAFGLQGQKCSACSRVFVEAPVKEAFLEKLLALTSKLAVGDPTRREVYMGPVVNRSGYESYKGFIQELARAGTILTGGKVLTEGVLAKGYFCAPTLVDNLPMEHKLWQEEMFLPITTIHAVDTLDEAMRLANDVNYGLTAGFYGSKKEAAWWFDKIQAGVCYANRPQGATTGAWPGFQPFGGWKGSGSSGKNAGGLYYLPLYMHEQIRTLISR